MVYKKIAGAMAIFDFFNMVLYIIENVPEGDRIRGKLQELEHQHEYDRSYRIAIQLRLLF
jgi:hypothetical protein